MLWPFNLGEPTRFASLDNEDHISRREFRPYAGAEPVADNSDGQTLEHGVPEKTRTTNSLGFFHPGDLLLDSK